MKLNKIESRLKHIPGVLRVAGAVDFASITERPIKVSPTLFVIPLRDQFSENNRATGPLSQKATEKFGVVIGIRDASNKNSSNELLEELRAKIRKQLFGYEIDGYEPIELGAGGIVGAFHSTFYWQDEFITGHHEYSQE